MQKNYNHLKSSDNKKNLLSFEKVKNVIKKIHVIF